MTSIPTQQAPIAESASFSQGERRMLGLDLDSWNNLLIAFLLIAAVFGVFAGVATYCVVKLQKADALASAKRIVSLEHETSAARLETERLKAATAWRAISPADMDILRSELAKGSGEIDLAFNPADPEAKYFALQVIGNGGFAATNDSSGTVKWRVHLRQWHSDGMFFGISIPGPENAQVKLLRHAFEAAHIKFTTESPPEEVPPISIGVGLKYSPAPKHDALIVVGLREPPL